MINVETKYIGALDKIAVSTSAMCALHCMCLPLLLGFFPAVGATFFGEESFHVLLLWCVIPLSIISLSIGCRKHNDKFVATLGVVGLTLLSFVAFFGHEILGEDGERVGTLLGAIIIAGGHMRNYALCRRVECDH